MPTFPGPPEAGSGTAGFHGPLRRSQVLESQWGQICNFDKVRIVQTLIRWRDH